MTKNGVQVASGALPDSISRRAQEKEFTLALPAIQPEPGAEYWLNLSFVLKADTLWAKKGHEIAWDSASCR